MSNKITIAVLHALMIEQHDSLINTIKDLRTEVTALKTELATVKTAQTELPTPITDNNKLPNDYASVVKETVRSVFKDETVKKEVIIHLPENKHDETDINELCQKVNITVKPCAITRLGKPEKDKKRPLKASFPSPFDARAFMAKVDAFKKQDTTDKSLSDVICRPCRTRDEQARYAYTKNQVTKLNNEAKAAGVLTESYSARSDGQIWKYKKNDNKWSRVTEWTFSDPAIPAAGPTDQGN